MQRKWNTKPMVQFSSKEEVKALFKQCMDALGLDRPIHLAMHLGVMDSALYQWAKTLKVPEAQVNKMHEIIKENV